MTTTQEAHDREQLLDQQAQRVTCASCGTPLLSEHGIIHMSETPHTGVTWWQCPNPDCGRRIKEEYRVEDNMIVSTAIEEV